MKMEQNGTSDIQNRPDIEKLTSKIDQNVSKLKSEVRDTEYIINCNIDVKPDFQMLQTQISKCEIKQEITQVDIKNEVGDDEFENYSEDPLKVEIKIEDENDSTQIDFIKMKNF